MREPTQLTFTLPVVENRARGDFFVAPSNALAFQMLEEWQDWPARKLILIGPAGAGKSHLAAIWQESAGALEVTANTLRDADIPALAAQKVVVEDIDRLALDAHQQEALFHLHNALSAAGRALLLTARTPPRDWPLTLPDLQSRLAAIPTCRIGAPDESLLAAVLVKQFGDRQIAVPPNVITYLTSRMERSLATARNLVAMIDEIALSEKRAVSRKLAERVLETLDKAQGTGA